MHRLSAPTIVLLLAASVAGAIATMAGGFFGLAPLFSPPHGLVAP